MNFHKPLWLTTVLISTIILSACNIGAPAPAQDPGVIQTESFNLVLTQAALQQTQTAMAVPPTPLPTNTPQPTPTLGALPTFALTTGTPFAFNTQQPGFTPIASPVATSAETCTKLEFISDVTVPDGTVLRPGVEFRKVWRVMNTGTCAWDEGYTLVYLGGSLDGYNIKIEKSSQIVEPGEITDFEVDLTASLAPNHYEECWRMKDDRGYFFGSYLCVVIDIDD